MNVQTDTDTDTETDHAAMAGYRIEEALEYVFTDVTDDTAIAIGQAQATLAVAHAILALAHEIRAGIDTYAA